MKTRTCASIRTVRRSTNNPGSLLGDAYEQFGAVPTLLERDFNFPPIEELLNEVRKIKSLQEATRLKSAANG